MDVNYTKPSEVSLNYNRDKSLVARSLVMNLFRRCVICGREYKPYVQFPLVYGVACGACRPMQSLSRFSAKDIPNAGLNKSNIEKALSYYSRQNVPYPTCKQVFAHIDLGQTKKL